MLVRSIRIQLGSAWLLVLTSCGAATFGDGSVGKTTPGTTPTPPATDDVTPMPQKVDLLTWFWQCDSAPAKVPATAGSHVVISGGGDHKFQPNAFSKTPLTFSGKVCPPVTYPRDIVFVIDVSGSMSGKDPIASNSCGRLNAIEAVINDIKSRGGDARYGIVTFSSGLVSKSSTMFSDKANLYADLTKGASILNFVCAADGDTSYGSGLGAAESMLNGSRKGAIKEVYMVSDGEPTDSLAGKDIATRLRSPGVKIDGKSVPVTIATAMIGNGNDSVLKNDIASTDNSGAPLHAGSVQASALAQTLSKLAANDIQDGKMKYRSIGTNPWSEISLTPNPKDYSFSMPSITLDKDAAPKGLEVSFEYRDKHNNVYSSQGKILWSDSASSSKLLEE